MAAKWSTDWTAADKATIRAALDRQYAGMQSPDAKAWYGTVDPDHVYHVICETKAFESILLNGYLLCMVLDYPWWTRSVKVLHEQMLLKVDPNAWNLRSVIREMVNLGRITGAAGIASGTALSTNDRRLARVYERFGFQTTDHSLYLAL
ncbi:hypothetical protein [Paraburkholderia youngii]|uniref:N-acetyltransferase domain-containing protein n=1 Tax=Paraburkholderia youngii TaxID=2782701 RepID=A0A7Y6JU74_9BURK|nr:hypothetical protein [Paraburkholderia youngii]NUX98776.1 hypothetical protein [Paraburkholderia youngii]